ncbi:MAG: alpha/beta hydrolase [Anaerolineae bacterium]
MRDQNEQRKGYFMPLSICGALTALLTSSVLLAVVFPVIAESWATRPPFPPTSSVNPLTAFGLAYQEVAFRAADGLTLRGWLIPAKSPDAPAIVYAHGAGQDQRSGLSLVPPLHQAGYTVLLFSYRGHGYSDSDGCGITYGYRESQDIDSAVRFLQQTKRVLRVGVIGYSIGASSALLSAARNPGIQAVLVVAPFASPWEVWMANRPAFLPRFVFDWIRRVVEWHKGISLSAMDLTTLVTCIAPRPLLLVHGSSDERIPLVQVQRLFAAADQPKSLWLIEGETHGSIRSHGLEANIAEIIRFFDEAFRLDSVRRQ